MSQTTLKAKPATKKRPKPDSENEEEDDDTGSDNSILSTTPPKAKKLKKGPAPKKIAARPLQEIENEAMNGAIEASIMVDGSSDVKPKKGSKSTDQYQKVDTMKSSSFAQVANIRDSLRS